MPRKSWEPKPDEKDFFTEVYLDESSHNNHHYLVVGGIIVSREHAAWLEEQIASSRDNRLPLFGEGKARTLKWEKVKNHNYRDYMAVVDHYVTLGSKIPLPAYKNFVRFHAIAADLTKRKIVKYSEGDEDLAFSKELNYLCAHRFGRLHPKALFHVFPDRRVTNITERQAKDILNFTIAKRGWSYEREWPVRKFEFKEPEQYQALQLVDVLCGAIAYRLNDQEKVTEKRAPNKGKLALCDHVWRKLRLRPLGLDSFSATPSTLFYRKYVAN